jgi:hypothetical protein
MEQYHNEGDNVLNYIITGNETWIHGYELQSKRQSVQWDHPSSPASRKFMTQPSGRMLMLKTFWDSHGPILQHYHEHGTTVLNTRYSDML